MILFVTCLQRISITALQKSMQQTNISKILLTHCLRVYLKESRKWKALKEKNTCRKYFL